MVGRVGSAQRLTVRLIRSPLRECRNGRAGPDALIIGISQQNLTVFDPARAFSRTGTDPAIRIGGGCHLSTANSDSAVMEPRLGRSVSIDQAAQLLNVSRRTIYNRIREGRLQTIRTLGGSQRVLVESLHDLGFRPQAFPTSASAASFVVRPARS